MNELGEPNMGNPSVRFDEGRERVGHWPVGLSIPPFLPTLQNEETPIFVAFVSFCRSELGSGTGGGRYLFKG